MKKIIGLIAIGFLASNSINGQYNKNFISPGDTSLKIEEGYNNPYRACYNVGLTIGADGSKTTAGVYYDISGAFSLKGFLVRTNIAKDLSHNDLISNTHPLSSYRNEYSNMQVSGFFNFKDEVYEETLEPEVAFEAIEFISNDKVRGYAYNVKQNVKFRKSFGVGGSFILLKNNIMMSQASNSNFESITLVNNIQPEYLIMPYQTSIIGIGVQQSRYTSYKYKYKYKNFRKKTFKETFFRTIQYEVLFAPSFSYDKMVVTKTGNTITEIELEKVKKNPFGIRFFYHSNLYSGKKRGKKPGLYFNSEGGIRPGIYANTFPDAIYFRLGAGLTI